MKTIRITKLDLTTEPICAIYICGGFEVRGETKTHRPALDFLRPGYKEYLSETCAKAEKHCTRSIELIENIIIKCLGVNNSMVFQDIRYIFDIDDFSDKKAMKYLVWEILAQVNEE